MEPAVQVSHQPAVYAHSSDSDLDESTLKVYGIETQRFRPLAFQRPLSAFATNVKNMNFL